MRPLTARALLLLALSAPLRAGQVQGPVSGDFQTGTHTGAIGKGLKAADLDWTLQNDADFVNQFVDRNAAHR